MRAAKSSWPNKTNRSSNIPKKHMLSKTLSTKLRKRILNCGKTFSLKLISFSFWRHRTISLSKRQIVSRRKSGTIWSSKYKRRSRGNHSATRWHKSWSQSDHRGKDLKICSIRVRTITNNKWMKTQSWNNNMARYCKGCKFVMNVNSITRRWQNIMRSLNKSSKKNRTAIFCPHNSSSNYRMRRSWEVETQSLTNKCHWDSILITVTQVRRSQFLSNALIWEKWLQQTKGTCHA